MRRYLTGSLLQILLVMNNYGYTIYFISVSRYSSILNVNKKLSYYAFPFGKKQCLKSLKKAKKDFIKYFEFYLTNDDNLFEKVLKLKDIRI